ncbi:serpin family protein [Mariniblastus sp.]|nr:serpin family protein [Mariniblastus sp.]
MKIFATCCLILVIAVVLFQFTGEEKKHSHQIKPLRPASFPSQSESDALTKAHNEFGFKLYRELQKESNGENVFISPTSIATAFGMLYNGTVDQVRSEFDEVFEFTKVPDESFNTANQSLLWNLATSDKLAELDIANSIWIKSGFPVKPEFISTNVEHFDAVIKNAPFSPQTVKDINQWCSDKTRGKITSPLSKLTPDDIMVLVNAVYFKGLWQNPFDKQRTQAANFTLVDNSQVSVPLMAREGSCHFLENDEFQAVRLPFGNGKMAMSFILPKKGLEAFQQSISTESFVKLQSEMRQREVMLLVPRFKIELQNDLKRSLKSLGMNEAFNFSMGFSSIYSNEPLQISQVIHNTFLEVKEEGAEAAAVTVIALGIEMAAMEEVPVMQIDRPFFCAISNIETGNVIFLGSIFNPLM